ncbi:MAG: 50S ribosomal protein L23 [Elusimicrobia bacterium]|nr:50S ribosomal protein L23 [Elusimicrobiota bacterium]
MFDPYRVILRPLMTERSLQMRDQQNQYVFVVHRKATKGDIARAVESLFRVDVVKVRTAILPGKSRRMGRFEGQRPDWKKAIVRLKPNQKIDLVEQST